MIPLFEGERLRLKTDEEMRRRRQWRKLEKPGE
jgi:hypothetical protein